MSYISCKVIFPGDNPEVDTAIEQHGGDGLNSTVRSLMHVIRTEDKQA